MELWQCFSDDARRAILAAHRAAVGSGAPLICPEHLLLSLMKVRGGVAAEVLQAVGVDAEQLGHELLSESTPASDTTSDREVSFTLDAQRSLQCAYREYRQMGSEQIGTGHLLLGLVQEGGELAGRLVAEGLSCESVRTLLDASEPQDD